MAGLHHEPHNSSRSTTSESGGLPSFAALPKPPASSLSDPGFGTRPGAHATEYSEVGDVSNTLKALERMVGQWQHLRKARRETVKAAQDEALALKNEAKDYGRMLGKRFMTDDPPSSRPPGPSTPQLPGAQSNDSNSRRGSGRGRARAHKLAIGEFQCHVRRPNKFQSDQSTLTVFPDQLRVDWTQILYPHQRTVVLSARNVIGAKLEADGKATFVRIHVLTTPTEYSPEGISEHEVYDLTEFGKPAEAEACCECIQKMAASVRPGDGNGIMYMIVNPVSGHRLGEAIYQKIRPWFDMAQVPIEGGRQKGQALLTTHAGHAKEFIKTADFSQCSGIVCIGGDGTVCEVLNGIMERADSKEVLEKVPIGAIPAGSECALAKMVGYTNPTSATYVILKGHKIRPIDVLKIRQAKKGVVMYSICGVGWGLAGKLAEDSESLRAAYGPARYLVSGVKSFLNLRGCPGTLEVWQPPDAEQESKKKHEECGFGTNCPVCLDGERNKDNPDTVGKMLEVKGPFVVVAMLKSEKALAPYVHLSDGYVDVLAVPEVSRLELLLRSTRILTSSHIADGQCLYWKTRRVVLKPESTADKINVDGEVLDGETTEIEVLPAALRVFSAFEESQQKKKFV